MVRYPVRRIWPAARVSVLALSSRFDGRQCTRASNLEFRVSVLALSSRFDGLFAAFTTMRKSIRFQYSLCRVVLMVFLLSSSSYGRPSVSVLALSSRFDGPQVVTCAAFAFHVSVLALSSRFDGLYGNPGITCVPLMFQYSLCRVVLMVAEMPVLADG